MEGKSKAARRILPMTPRVYHLLMPGTNRLVVPPKDGFFPSSSKSGHLNGDAAKDQHKKAVDDMVDVCSRTSADTALTRLGERAGGDVFVFARIAGHSSITVTQRYFIRRQLPLTVCLQHRFWR